MIADEPEIDDETTLLDLWLPKHFPPFTEAEIAEFIDETKLTEKPTMKKPQCVYIDPTAVGKLKDPDCLSLKATIFRNGGRVSVSGEDEMIEAVPFVELTPDLLVWLRDQEFDSRSGVVRWGFTARLPNRK